MTKKCRFLRALISVSVSFFLLCDTALLQAQMPPSGSRPELSNPLTPSLPMGIVIHPQRPFAFHFLVSPADGASFAQADIQEDTLRFAKYFLAGIVVPEEEISVNLDPLQNKNIMSQALARTDAGADMLDADYELKQLTAALINPQNDLGRRFWDEIYRQGYVRFGESEMNVDAFNRVWIVPQEAEVLVNGNTALITKARLKVMLEDDFLALKGKNGDGQDQIRDVVRDAAHDMILPVLEKEINEGARFFRLRQLFHAMILAGWYKQTLKDGFFAKSYAGTAKVSVIESPRGDIREETYEHYIEAYRSGVYNFINEENDPVTQMEISRKYSCGGISGFASAPHVIDAAQVSSQDVRHLMDPLYYTQSWLKAFGVEFAPTPLRKIPIDTVDLAVVKRMNRMALSINPGPHEIRWALVGRSAGQDLVTYEAALPFEVQNRHDYNQLALEAQEAILRHLNDLGIVKEKISAVCGRGGFLEPTRGGLIRINEEKEGAWSTDQDIETDLTVTPGYYHEANFGALTAAGIANTLGVPAFTLDPVTTDDRIPEAVVSGQRGQIRVATGHALSLKAAARLVLEYLGNDHLGLIVVHLGRGTTVGAVQEARIIDQTSSVLGDGPFSPRRGRMDQGNLIRYVLERFRLGRQVDEIQQELTSRGGLVSYLGTDDLQQVEQMIVTGEKLAREHNIRIDPEWLSVLLNSEAKEYEKRIGSWVSSWQREHLFARLSDDVVRQALIGQIARAALKAMAFQTVKSMSSLVPGLRRNLKGFVLTGGGANSKMLVEEIEAQLNDGLLAEVPLHVLPGSVEQWAMARAAYLAVERGEKGAAYTPVQTALAKPLLEHNPFAGIDLTIPQPQRRYSVNEVDDVLELAKTMPPRTIALAEPNEEGLEALQLAYENGLYKKAFLVGKREVIEGLIRQVPTFQIPHEIVENYNGLQLDDSTAMARAAVLMVKNREADFVMKGKMSTDVIIGEVLRQKITTQPFVSWVTLTHSSFEDSRLIVATDAGITVAPTNAHNMIGEIRNAVYIARVLGMPENVILVSSSEKLTRAPGALLQQQASRLPWESGVIVQGPMSLDGGLSESHAAEKGIKGPAAGQGRILVFEGIPAANIFYKVAAASGLPLGSVVVGAPVIFTSRADKPKVKLVCMALTNLVNASIGDGAMDTKGGIDFAGNFYLKTKVTGREFSFPTIHGKQWDELRGTLPALTPWILGEMPRGVDIRNLMTNGG
jgi:butyrate kinase